MEREFSFRLESIVRGHNVYKSVWTPFNGEILPLSIEDGNEHDSFAVAVLKDTVIVGHAPRELSRVFYFFLRHDGSINAEITGHRKFGCGLEVPCWYTLTGKPKFGEAEWSFPPECITNAKYHSNLCYYR